MATGSDIDITTLALSNILISGGGVSNGIQALFQDARGIDSEKLYGDMRQPSLSLSGDAPPTEVNLQGRMSPTKSLKGEK